MASVCVRCRRGRGWSGREAVRPGVRCRMASVCVRCRRGRGWSGREAVRPGVRCRMASVCVRCRRGRGWSGLGLTVSGRALLRRAETLAGFRRTLGVGKCIQVRFLRLPVGEGTIRTGTRRVVRGLPPQARVLKSCMTVKDGGSSVFRDEPDERALGRPGLSTRRIVDRWAPSARPTPRGALNGQANAILPPIPYSETPDMAEGDSADKANFPLKSSRCRLAT